METNAVNFFTMGEDLGTTLGDAVSSTIEGLASSFETNAYGDTILSSLAVVAIVFLVIAGFWIVVRNLIRAANMTGRRR